MVARFLIGIALLVVWAPASHAQVAVQGQRVYTMAGQVIENGLVLIRDGKIVAIGAASEINVPDGFQRLEAAVVTPGLVDAHSVVGLAGIYNYNHDQDQLESAEPIQPELRAIDAYNVREPLIEWVRGLGVTTIHTGHAPGELISGQTMVVKTVGDNVEQAALVSSRAVACSLTTAAQKSDTRSPGTRGKMLAMLRQQLLKAQEYRRQLATAAEDRPDQQQPEAHSNPPARDLRLEVLAQVLDGKLPLLITADRAQDITSALRLADEFQIPIWLDSAAESYLLIDEIKAAGVPVILHPTMARATGDRENLSFETAARLVEAGIPVALQSGYESYVPKTRVVLFEAAMAAAHGLSFEQALATVTIDAAKILGVHDRVGSLEIGKDGDLALFDGDPFQYTTKCVGVVIEGRIVSQEAR